MNLSLIDPFILAQDYPDALTSKIRMWTRFLHPPHSDADPLRLRSCHLPTIQSQRRSTRIGKGTSTRPESYYGRVSTDTD